MAEGIKKAHFVMGVYATPEGRWHTVISNVALQR